MPMTLRPLTCSELLDTLVLDDVGGTRPLIFHHVWIWMFRLSTAVKVAKAPSGDFKWAPFDTCRPSPLPTYNPPFTRPCGGADMALTDYISCSSTVATCLYFFLPYLKQYQLAFWNPQQPTPPVQTQLPGRSLSMQPFIRRAQRQSILQADR
jgi:hypothetical protein